MLSGSDGIPALFEGDKKLPVYNTAVSVSGIMTMVGKIFSHAIVQVGIGPCFFCTTIYKYLCEGEISSILGDIDVSDVTSKNKHYIDEVYPLY